MDEETPIVNDGEVSIEKKKNVYGVIIGVVYQIQL